MKRLADATLAAAARRWPADLSDVMAREWQAELDAIRADPTLGPLTRLRRTIAFAGSIALSPAVEEPGGKPATWGDRAAEPCRPAAVAAGVTLLAAALCNVVHLASAEIRLGAVGLLAAAALVMMVVGSRARGGAVRATMLLAVALFGFLLAGNHVAVMPFMGWIDILPAVASWAVLIAAAATATTRLAAAGHRVLGLVAGVGGGLVALELATIAGSLHAAHALGLGLAEAPWWLALALLPGGMTTFGAWVPDGTAYFPSSDAALGGGFHTSDVLLGNASAMAGPLLLCSIYVITRAITPPRRGRRAPVLSSGVAIAVTGAGGGLLALAACEMMRRSAGTVDAALPRVLDNSTIFGFGFLAATPGRIALALLIGLLIAGPGTGRTSTT